MGREKQVGMMGIEMGWGWDGMEWICLSGCLGRGDGRDGRDGIRWNNRMRGPYVTSILYCYEREYSTVPNGEIHTASIRYDGGTGTVYCRTDRWTISWVDGRITLLLLYITLQRRRVSACFLSQLGICLFVCLLSVAATVQYQQRCARTNHCMHAFAPHRGE
jgi:hypothetical protein